MQLIIQQLLSKHIALLHSPCLCTQPQMASLPEKCLALTMPCIRCRVAALLCWASIQLLLVVHDPPSQCGSLWLVQLLGGGARHSGLRVQKVELETLSWQSSRGVWSILPCKHPRVLSRVEH